MSIIHKALKKAEAGGDRERASEGSAAGGGSKRMQGLPIKRMALYLVLFFISLGVIYYIPIYNKNRALERVKRNMKVGGQSAANAKTEETPLTESAASELPVALSGVSADELNKKGIYYYKEANYAKAKEYFSAALKTGERLDVTYNNLGLTLKKMKMYRESEEYYIAALGLNPNYKECYNNLGVLYDNLNEFEKAQKHFKKAIKLDHNYPDPYFNAAVTYEKMKKFKAAGTHYADFLRLTGERLTGERFASDKNSAFLSGIKKKVEILMNQ